MKQLVDYVKKRDPRYQEYITKIDNEKAEKAELERQRKEKIWLENLAKWNAEKEAIRKQHEDLEREEEEAEAEEEEKKEVEDDDEEIRR